VLLAEIVAWRDKEIVMSIRSTHRLTAKFHSSMLCVLVLFTAIGCGGSSGPPVPAGPKGTATGTITHGGAPVTQGTLHLDAGQGYMVTSVIGPDGSFELTSLHGKSVPVGKYKVAVIPPVDSNAPVTPEKMAEMRKGAKSKDGVPEKFTRHSSSGVTVEIKEGAQVLDIELK